MRKIDLYTAAMLNGGGYAPPGIATVGDEDNQISPARADQLIAQFKAADVDSATDAKAPVKK